MEHWGCPWSRKPDGHVNVRAFGGMKIERTWFAADKTGFHMLHTLFQTSIKYPSIRRFDEHFCVDLVVDDGRVQGVVAIEIASGEFRLIQAKAVIIATGGAGRVFRENTNGGIVTGDGMALAYRHGVPLRDMEFVQYHPTCMPGTGLLFTEACRGEGGFLLNKDGYRYLQDYGLGPADAHAAQQGDGARAARPPEPGLLAREAEGPHDRRPARRGGAPRPAPSRRDRSCASGCRRSTSWRWNTSASTRRSEPIPVLPAVHYTMGGIMADSQHRRAAARPVLGRRVFQRRHPRRQPAGLEFADRAARVRQGGRRRGRALRGIGAARQPIGGRRVGRGGARARIGRRGGAAAASASPRCAARWRKAWKTAAASTAARRPCRPPATSWPS